MKPFAGGLPPIHHYRRVGMKLTWKKYQTDVSNVSEDEKNILQGYGHYVFRKYLLIILCIIATILIAGLSISIGIGDIGIIRAYQILIEHLQGNIMNEVEDYIVCYVRLPPLLGGLIAGAGLAIAGAVMQSTLKNPLADPYTTGISSGASFGATLSIVMGINIVNNQYGIVLNAFLFSLIPMFAIMIISSTRRASPTTIILAGLAVMYMFNAMTTVMMLSADPNAMAAAYSWQVGTLSLVTMKDLPVMFGFVLVGGIFLMLLSSKINILSTGDESAKSLGVNANVLRITCLLIVSLIAAAIVSFTGVIGFVGLICPHICRMLIGSDNRYLLPASAIFGAMFLILANLIGNNIIAPTSLQVGVITAFLGAPILIFLLIKIKKEAW